MRQALQAAMALAGLLLATPILAADKAELFKCEDAKGAISIQSSPCAKGSTQVWRRDATPEPPPSPEQMAQADAKRERDQRVVRELSAEMERKLKPPAERKPAPVADPPPDAPADAPAADAPDRCAQAQDFAAQLREKDWLNLSEDQVRRLYGWVSTQCQPARAAP